MSVICTLEEVKQHLRYDADDNDVELEIYLEAAEEMVFNYVDDEYRYLSEFPQPFRTAVLVLVGYHDAYRNGEGVQKMQMGKDTALIDGNFLPPAVRFSLFPYRTLTVG